VIFQSDLPDKQKILIKRVNFVGRLSVEKQPSWLIEIVRETSLPARFIGDGILIQELQQSTKDLKPEVEFLGYVSDPWEYFEDSDLLIVPSLFEGDGLVIVEAILRGIPILLNDIPDLRRFQLPEVNYCASVNEFSQTIMSNLEAVEKFIVSRDIVEVITSSRDPKFVASQWRDFLKELETKS
jgi:glycosyltransferase involved in cell wall biosynthesis